MPICYNAQGVPFFQGGPCPPPPSAPAPGTLGGGAPVNPRINSGNQPTTASGQISSATSAVGQTASNAGTTVNNIIQGANPFSWLSDPTNLKRLGLVGGAVLLVVLGTALLLFGPAEKVATTGIKAGA